jgi:hypothetical protein
MCVKAVSLLSGTTNKTKLKTKHASTPKQTENGGNHSNLHHHKDASEKPPIVGG